MITADTDSKSNATLSSPGVDGSPKPRILYVITKSNWGGAQRYVYDLATSLNKGQFEVAVTLGGNGTLKDRLTAAHIPVFTLDKLERDLSVTGDVGGFSSIYRAIREYKPHTVHLNSSKAGGLGALAARLLGVPRIVFTVHGWPFEERRNILWRTFVLTASYLTALLCHKVIVITKKDLQLGKRMPFCAKKMHLIYNGIGPMEFGSGELIRNSFPSGERITGTVGELTKNKNQMALIENAHMRPDRYVAIVGEGEERARLETKIKEYGLTERVKLFGFRPANEVLRGFDIFALPSLKEGLPYVLLEAKAAGFTSENIEANPVGGVPDVLQDASDFKLDRMVQETVALY